MTLCRERGAQRSDVIALRTDIDSLQHHLEDLDDRRKMLHTKAAVLTRCDTYVRWQSRGPREGSRVKAHSCMVPAAVQVLHSALAQPQLVYVRGT